MIINYISSSKEIFKMSTIFNASNYQNNFLFNKQINLYVIDYIYLENSFRD